ncbi:right-handed parallel beta-helix repeat-containing protein [Proteinivorax hydrogeniformans]|uniref:Right-handed parallel beta-helix repeat-containing protein n=1 Tax=Proteinivorax hydrogeniformans TaxID=1826727 RepID=A0AAU8HQN2_9FIRM
MIRRIFCIMMALALCFMFVPEVSAENWNKGLKAGSLSVTTHTCTEGHGTVKGYYAGFRISEEVVMSSIESIKLTLFNGNKTLKTLNAKIDGKFGELDAGGYSAPFDVYGDFNYEEDGYWETNGWKGTFYEVPTHFEVEITYNNGEKEHVVSDESLKYNFTEKDTEDIFPSLHDVVADLDYYNNHELVADGSTIDLTGYKEKLTKPLKIQEEMTIRNGKIIGKTKNRPGDTVYGNVIVLESNNIKIENVKIENQSTSHPTIRVDGVDNIKLDNNTIDGAIGGNSDGKVDIINNDIRNSVDEGIWLVGNGEYTIENNTVTNAGGACIKLVANKDNIPTVNEQSSTNSILESLRHENTIKNVILTWVGPEPLPETSESRIMWLIPAGLLVLVAGAFGYKRFAFQE